MLRQLHGRIGAAFEDKVSGRWAGSGGRLKDLRARNGTAGRSREASEEGCNRYRKRDKERTLVHGASVAGRGAGRLAVCLNM